ncbi:MAG: hypothetical protein DI539_27490, partial [Flavobacterium psychrophilum]
ATGNPLHRIAGFKQVSDFVKEIGNSQKEEKQIYSRIAIFYSGKMPFHEMPSFQDELIALKLNSLADSVALKYIGEYAGYLNSVYLFNKDMLLFLARNIKLVTTSHQFIRYCIGMERVVDSICGIKGFSESVVNYCIDRDIITSMVKKAASEPNWDSVGGVIKKGFGSKFVAENILDGRVSWYRKNKRYELYTKYLTQKINQSMPFKVNKSDLIGWVSINNQAFEVFSYSNNEFELQSALKWINIVLTNSPDNFMFMDTKANILHKLKMTSEAIKLQERVLKLAILDNKGNENAAGVVDVKNVLAKMKAGIPTWTEENNN